MWKCKKCGCTNFKLGIGGYVEVDFNRIGMEKIYETTLEIINKELEELTDVYFFFAQLINYKSRDGRFQIEYYYKEFEIFPCYYAGA